MEITIQYPKPKPILGVCFLQIFLPEHKIPQIKPQDQTSLALLKYFPKYIHNLPSNLSHLKTRIKHLKLVKKIPNNHPNNILRILFANKRKHTRLVNGIENREYRGRYSEKNLELLKMFPSLQKVEFCIVVPYFQDKYHQNQQDKQCYWIDRMVNYLNRMTNLKYLKLSNRGFFLLPLLSKLNSFETMLSRLEVFKLNFVLIGRDDFPDFQALFNFKTILKHLTNLQLNSPEDKDFFELFQLLPNYCPQLLSLAYSINQRNSFSTFEEASFLQCLQSFQNLQKISLTCGYKLDAFRHCKFPTSLRFLDLYLSNIEWKSLVAENSPIVAFHDNHVGLENLEKLNLSLHLYHPTEDKDIVRDLIEDLLRKVLALKEFSMKFYPQLQIQQGTPSYPFDLSRFLSCFRHLSHSLQKLTIIDCDSRYNITNLKNLQAFHFPELSYLSIKGKSLPSLPEIENIIKLTQVKPERPAPCVKLQNIKIDSCKAFLELLSSLKKISGKQIELVVEYYSTIEDDEYFKENYEQVKKDNRNLRNVTLEIKFSIAWPRFRWKKELMSLKECFGNLVVIERVHF